MRLSSKKFIEKGKLPLTYLFLAGIFLGMILVNFGKKVLLADTGMLNEEALYHMKYMTVDGNALFWYVMGIRLKTLVGLVVLATTYLGLVAVGCAAVNYGVLAGMFLVSALMRYGVKGILLVITAIFPQYLIYGPAFFFLLIWCEQICRLIYFEKGARLGSRQFVLVKLLQLLGIIAVIITGCALESYVNPMILIKLLKNF